MDFYLYLSRDKYFQNIFSSEPNVKISKDAPSPFIKGFISTLFCKIVLSEKYKSIFKHSILRKIAYYLALGGPKTKKERAVCIFTGFNKFAYDEQFFLFAKKHFPNLIMIRWFLDLVKIGGPSDEKEKLSFLRKNFDAVISYDPIEAKTYGFYHIETPYVLGDIGDEEIIYDVVFVGKSKIDVDERRYSMLLELHDLFSKKHLNFVFYITGVPDSKKINSASIVYNKTLDYENVLRLNKKANCILDVSQAGESGTTLRFFEAISMDKRFLSNNPTLGQNELFSKENMRIYSSIEDIDVGFICNKEPVYYDYKERISPEVFLNKVKVIANGIESKTKEDALK